MSGQTSGLLNIHEVSDSVLILSLYNLIICVVAAALYAPRSAMRFLKMQLL